MSYLRIRRLDLADDHYGFVQMHGVMRYPQLINEALTNVDVNQTITEQLQMRRDGLAAELASVDAALAVLKENPTLQQAFDTISKVMRY